MPKTDGVDAVRLVNCVARFFCISTEAVLQTRFFIFLSMCNYKGDVETQAMKLVREAKGKLSYSEALAMSQ